MRLVVSNKPQFGLLSKTSLIIVTGLFLHTGFVNAEDFPPGFKRLANGDVVVDDVLKAVPPKGYYIAENATLKKIGEPVLTTLAVTTLADSTDTPVPPGFHRLSDGRVKVKNIDVAAVPQGFELLPGGYLVEKGSALSEPAPVVSTSTQIAANTEIMEVPAGFHRMANGDVMANFPSKAVAPPGYRLTEAGVLRKIDDKTADAKQPVVTSSSAQLESPPPGFHRMADGTFMANFPSKAVAPEGYHLLPDGTLVANNINDARRNTAVDHSAHKSSGGGMWMFDYKYTRMYMEDMLDTTTTVTAAQAVDPAGIYGFMMAPTDMSMDMHMFMLMYHSQSYMLMGMLHYMSNEMGMLSVDGTTSTMESSGLADTVVTATFPATKHVSFMVGLSLPTGSIDERGPMTHLAGVTQQDVKYPYGMQLGSGSYELKQGISYETSPGNSQWGLSYEYTAILNENDNDYKRGNTLLVDGWMKWQLTNTFSTNAKLQFRTVEQIEGVDAELELVRAMSPTMDARSYGGRRADLGLGLRYENSSMTSVSLDLVIPVHQNLYGPQMQTQWIATLGLGFMF